MSNIKAFYVHTDMNDVLNEVLTHIAVDAKHKRKFRETVYGNVVAYSHSSVRLVNLSPNFTEEYIRKEMMVYGPILKIKRTCNGNCAIITFKFVLDAINLLHNGLNMHSHKYFNPTIEICPKQDVKGVMMD